MVGVDDEDELGVGGRFFLVSITRSSCDLAGGVGGLAIVRAVLLVPSARMSPAIETLRTLGPSAV